MLGMMITMRNVAARYVELKLTCSVGRHVEGEKLFVATISKSEGICSARLALVRRIRNVQRSLTSQGILSKGATMQQKKNNEKRTVDDVGCECHNSLARGMGSGRRVVCEARRGARPYSGSRLDHLIRLPGAMLTRVRLQELPDGGRV